ncbi:serum amyloid P-component-like [Centroberyx gerrardi]|uniref:serum amyloid P-component-like n=1 Tax=Centroberyx gerrardi TaxID=166262 RepID=UPI003AB03BA5
MEKFLLLMVLFATCYAAPQDLSGKVFVFPKETSTAHVKLLTSSSSSFISVTACLRFFTDLSRQYSLFSLATPSHSNDFLIIKINSKDVIDIWARDSITNFLAVSLERNTWHSMCATWTSDTGVAQLWVDGKPTVKRFIHSGRPITGPPITILGQEQDSYGGGFDATQSFIGMLSDVHMWDYVLSPSEIQLYMDDMNFTPGNIFNWRALEFQITGQILVEEKQESRIQQ